MRYAQKSIYFTAALSFALAAVLPSSLTFAQTTVSTAAAATATGVPVCPNSCTWPSLDVPPQPLPEMLAAINLSAIPAIMPVELDPVTGSPVDPYHGSTTANPNCDWSFNQCVDPADIITCPKGIWGLSYDDGPQPPSPTLYSYLKSQNQKATLFVIGSRVLEYPDELRTAYLNGHQIAVHTWSHPYLTNQTNEQIIGEMLWTAKIIKATIGVTPLYMRPPHGDIDSRVRALMKAMNFKVVMWNQDTNDWMATEQGFQGKWIDQNITSWASTINSSTTGIISLEHELSNVSVAEAIKSYPIMKAAGWKVMPVADCIGDSIYYAEQVVANASSTTKA